MRFIKTFLYMTLFMVFVSLTACTTTTDILAGSDGACGTLHIEGSFTDSQGDVIIFKVPEGWTAEQVKDLCSQ